MTLSLPVEATLVREERGLAIGIPMGRAVLRSRSGSQRTPAIISPTEQMIGFASRRKESIWDCSLHLNAAALLSLPLSLRP